MLPKEENELLCRVGPGTPMGDLLRQYWIPCLPSAELPEPDCPPLRVRLLGEDLIAFRDTNGEVGLVAENLPPPRRLAVLRAQRRSRACAASTTAGSSTSTGDCVDMPSEPPESNFKNKVHAIAYPCRDVNGMPRGAVGVDGCEISLAKRFAGQQATVFRTGDHAVVFVGAQAVRTLELDRSRRYQPSGINPRTGHPKPR